MTKQQHTPEPWEYYRIEPRTASDGFFEPYTPWFAGAGPRLVKVGRSLFIHADDMRRIVACVNACAGIPTDALESGVARQVRDEIESAVKLEKQRDDLLAALNKLSGMKLNMIADGIVDKAIASVKENDGSA